MCNFILKSFICLLRYAIILQVEELKYLLNIYLSTRSFNKSCMISYILISYILLPLSAFVILVPCIHVFFYLLNVYTLK